MKRMLSALLVCAIALLLPAIARATDNTQSQESLRKSEYCPSAAMFSYRDLFVEAEQNGSSVPLTRAMTAVILARYSSADETAVVSGYGDVPASVWYAFGASWNILRGILPAKDDGLFHGDEAMTRESLCLTLQNYLNWSGRSLGKINAWYSFLDAGEMTRTPRAAAALMQEAGIMIEEDNGFFYPANPVSVGEAENVFLRFFGCLGQDQFPSMPISTVEGSDPVDRSWFDDACFIGHSQVVGMASYSSLDNMDYFCAVGYTAQNILEDYVQERNQRYGTLPRILRNYAGNYKKVYIMLGINDCDNNSDRVELFMNPMRQILDLVRETQPDAKIYILSLAPVGRETPMNVIYNVENVIFYSQMLKSLSREYNTEYLDIFRLMADSEGYMQDRFNDGDGIHIKAAQYSVLEEFLKCHTGS